jgi:Tfp pilus assembly protein PilX
MNRISLSLAVRRRAQDDRGIALVVVVALMALIGVVIVTLVSLAIYESRASGRDRQRSSAVMTAEGQVDSLVSQIQTAQLVNLPCGGAVPNVSVASDVMSLTNTVKYFTAAGVEVPCATAQGGSTVLASATIKSTSTSQALAGQAPAVRTVETLLKLTPTYGNYLDRAIFGDAGISLANNADIYGQAGQPDADLYTNGSIACNNAVHFYGSIYAQGTVSMSNTCVVEVNVEAKLGFSATNPQVRVNGKVLVQHGNITLNSSTVGQQARASGTVTGTPCSTAGKCFSNDSTITPPPVQPFPVYNWDAPTQAAWVALGYTVQTFPRTNYPCGTYTGTGPYNGSVDNVARWVYENMATMPKTVIYANCPGNPFMVQQNHSTIALANDLAIFDTGGFTINNNTTIQSTDTTSHLLYLIQPYNSISRPCTVGITLNNQVTIDSTINDLLYSPCDIVKANNSTQYGQIYGGGSVTINNRLTMYYKPLPVPNGPTATGTPIKFYSADILYKRENNP